MIDNTNNNNYTNNNENTEFDVNSWDIVNDLNIDMTITRQNDGSSWGIFLVMFAFYWYTFRRLPNKDTDWNNDDVSDTIPNLRHFVLHFILNTVHKENERILDFTND